MVARMMEAMGRMNEKDVSEAYLHLPDRTRLVVKYKDRSMNRKNETELRRDPEDGIGFR